jgi:curved DNA-binding protein CbpA
VGGRGITWYDILGVLPDASADTIQQAYEAKASLLRPPLISGAPSKVLTAASRATNPRCRRPRCTGPAH